MVKQPTRTNSYVIPLNMNGLRGRMFRYSSKKVNPLDILFVYDHHSSLESCRGIIQLLYSSFGNVTAADLPGIGGMDSFYKIGKKPSINNYAAYMASLMKMQFKRKKIIIVGVGFGFVIVTRMLQHYPELQKNVKVVVALKGYADDDDFKLSKFKKIKYRYLAKLFSTRLLAIMARQILLNGPMLKLAYSLTPTIQERLQINKMSKKNSQDIISSEINLWQINDVRTFMKSVHELMMFSNCDQRIDLPVWHVAYRGDKLIDNSRAEQHLKVIYSNYRRFKTNGRVLPIMKERKLVNVWFPANLKKEILRFSSK